MSDPCEFTLPCNLFEPEMNATCFFVTPEGGGPHRMPAQDLANLTIATNSSQLCAASFIHTGTSQQCFVWDEDAGTCGLEAGTLAEDAFVSFPAGGMVVRKQTSSQPFFSYVNLPSVSRAVVSIVVRANDPCFPPPTKLVASNTDYEFRVRGSGVSGNYILIGPLVRPLTFDQPMYCDGNGWTGTELCLLAPNVTFPQFVLEGESAVATVFSTVIVCELALVLLWIVLRGC